MKRLGKLLSVLLCFVLMLNLLAAGVSAEDPTGDYLEFVLPIGGEISAFNLSYPEFVFLQSFINDERVVSSTSLTCVKNGSGGYSYYRKTDNAFVFEVSSSNGCRMLKVSPEMTVDDRYIVSFSPTQHIAGKSCDGFVIRFVPASSYPVVVPCEGIFTLKLAPGSYWKYYEVPVAEFFLLQLVPFGLFENVSLQNDHQFVTEDGKVIAYQATVDSLFIPENLTARDNIQLRFNLDRIEGIINEEAFLEELAGVYGEGVTGFQIQFGEAAEEEEPEPEQEYGSMVLDVTLPSNPPSLTGSQTAPAAPANDANPNTVAAPDAPFVWLLVPAVLACGAAVCLKKRSGR